MFHHCIANIYHILFYTGMHLCTDTVTGMIFSWKKFWSKKELIPKDLKAVSRAYLNLSSEKNGSHSLN